MGEAKKAQTDKKRLLLRKWYVESFSEESCPGGLFEKRVPVAFFTERANHLSPTGPLGRLRHFFPSMDLLGEIKRCNFSPRIHHQFHLRIYHLWHLLSYWRLFGATQNQIRCNRC